MAGLYGPGFKPPGIIRAVTGPPERPVPERPFEERLFGLVISCDFCTFLIRSALFCPRFGPQKFRKS